MNSRPTIHDRLPRRALCAGVFTAIVAGLTGQSPLQGNGIGDAFLTHSTARIGGSIDFALGSPAAASGIAVVGLSGQIQVTTHPIVGPVALDLAGVFLSEAFVLDAQGSVTPSQQIPNNPALLQLGPMFSQAVVFEAGGQISLSKATRVQWEVPDSYRSGGTMATARAAHTATALGRDARDNEARVLITGGGGGTLLVPVANDSTEIFDPLTRSMTAGPTMAVARALHAAVGLGDGRVLIVGGTDSQGIVSSSVEIFDPTTGSLLAAPSMLQPRAGHAATLLGNGKVLVSGGLSNYQNPLLNLAAVLNTAQNDAELFDPIAMTWTAVPSTMANGRSGHTQTLLADGRVLVAAGIQGGQTHPFGFDIPIYSQTCSIYDPTANSFAATGSLLLGRAFHATVQLPSGDVLLLGGSEVSPAFGLVSASAACERWNGTTWSNTTALPVGLTSPAVLVADDGNALVFGGLTGAFPTFVGADVAGIHDGTTFANIAGLGLNPGLGITTTSPRGAALPVRLHDGSIALFGGTNGQNPIAANLLYHP